MIYIKNRIIVNHRTYLRGLTSKGTIACTKRLPDVLNISLILKAEAEIRISMDRLTNLNSKAGSEVPFPNKDMPGVANYVVFSTLSQSKQPAKRFSKNEESPKDIIICRKNTKFGISRSMKVSGRRRIHSTVIICRKESSKFMIGGVKFEGFALKSQFDKLRNDIKNKKANNLIAILSERKYLIGCYQNIKFHIRKTNVTNLDWFKDTCNSFRNGSFRFKPFKKIYISQDNGKKKVLLLPSFKDKIVQNGIRIVLEIVFEMTFCNYLSNVIVESRDFHALLTQICIKFRKVNWFIEVKLDQDHSSINHKILIELLREKIQDEPFIDLIYKCLKVDYGPKFSDKIIPTTIDVDQVGWIISVLFNIYMGPLDEWMEKVLIPKYKSKVYYVRYIDNFLIGVQGSKKMCENIRSEIKSFLHKRLSIILSIDKYKIKHSDKGNVLFLGYHLSSTSVKSMPFEYTFKQRLVRKRIWINLRAPIQKVIQGLKEKGFLNSKNIPIRNVKYINMNLWNIVENYKSVERDILNYYSMANNYGRLAARVHYSLKYSCALTISSKMNLKTMRKTFKTYGKNLTIKVKDRSISFSKISYKKKNRKFLRLI